MSKRVTETSLYEKCPQCEGTGKQGYTSDGDDGIVPIHCVCNNGFIETGYTTERLDRMQRKIDELHALIDSVKKSGYMPYGVLMYTEKYEKEVSESVERHNHPANRKTKK